MPPEYRTWQAAQLLHCPPWVLEEREDGDWWIAHSILFTNAERKAQENWQKAGRKA